MNIGIYKQTSWTRTVFDFIFAGNYQKIFALISSKCHRARVFDHSPLINNSIDDQIPFMFCLVPRILSMLKCNYICCILISKIICTQNVDVLRKCSQASSDRQR